MTPTTTPMLTEITRRHALSLGLGLVALGALPRAAFALNTAQAEKLVGAMLAEITSVINSGRSENAMFGDFENIFARYADVPIIARSALGPVARSASGGQISAFTAAFRGYLARKYGRRFREFIGGRIEVTGSRVMKSFQEVISTAYLQGDPPFEVRWHVSDKSGKDLFFNIIIEGVNMLATERTEIGAMLDRRKGDVNALIADLKKAG